jgi:hypothetical protein
MLFVAVKRAVRGWATHLTYFIGLRLSRRVGEGRAAMERTSFCRS